MNAIDLLVNDHRRMEALWNEVVEADAEAREGLFARAADALAAHITVEEQHFYPAVKAHRTEDILLESLEEHLSLKRVLADLLALQPKDPHFEPKLHVLKEQTEHHHEEEEEHLFPKVRKLFDPRGLEELGVAMEAEMKRLEAEEPRRRITHQTDEAAPLH